MTRQEAMQHAQAQVGQIVELTPTEYCYMLSNGDWRMFSSPVEARLERINEVMSVFELYQQLGLVTERID